MSLISFEFALFLLTVLWLNWALRGRRTAYRVFLRPLTRSSMPLRARPSSVAPWRRNIELSLRAPCSRAKGNALRKVWLSADIILNLSFIAFFKYFEFLYQSLDSITAPLGLNLHLPFIELYFPIGISFFTLQGISYCIDVYRDPKRRYETQSHAYCCSYRFFPRSSRDRLCARVSLSPNSISPTGTAFVP